MAKKKKAEEGTINDILEQEQQNSISADEQLWGRNPKRTQLLRDLWYDSMIEQLDEEKDIPDEAKRELMFMMTANSVLDLILESLPEDASVELSHCIDDLMAMAAVNQRYDVDLLQTSMDVLKKIKREDFTTDKEFEAAVLEQEEKWWTVGKQQLGGRSPNDAVAEMLSKYGLSR